MMRPLATSRRIAPSRRAITLLEMLLATSLILLTMSTLFLFYEVSLGATRRTEKATLRTQQARVVLQQIAREIRQAYGGGEENIVGLSGTMHSLTLAVSALPEPTVMQTYAAGSNPLPPRCDLRTVQYFMTSDPDTPDEDGNPGLGLVRVEQRPGDEELVDQTQIDRVRRIRMIAADVKYIRFYYFDGTTWLDVWQGSKGTNGLPQAVKMEVGFTPDTAMLDGNELLTGTEVDLLGNPTDAPPAVGRYTLIVRPPTVGLFTGGSGQSQGLGGMDLEGLVNDAAQE